MYSNSIYLYTLLYALLMGQTMISVFYKNT